MKKDYNELEKGGKNCANCLNGIKGFNYICLAKLDIFSESKAYGCTMFRPNGKCREF